MMRLEDIEQAAVCLDMVMEGAGDVEEGLWRLYWFASALRFDDEHYYVPTGADEARRLQYRLHDYFMDRFPYSDDDVLRAIMLAADEKLGWPNAGDPVGRWVLAASHDWTEAFLVAMRDGIQAVDPDLGRVSTDAFLIRDVAECTGTASGENEGPNWLATGRLYDGRWFAVSSGCDYTGWG